ncbi:FAD dependent oxidoreductase [Phanerochaete sordida]|uniref:FAD dependent oxidoreductase n=1 Tax=Phanerochaete sordida TaxID=48140 RepID=A0A9P3GFB3_9APHY|nr:FAD dependent oxidoreductase [Phanerochaete sordida]
MSGPADVFLVLQDGELEIHEGPSPIPRTQRNSHIVIIGGGVTGLTTAWALLDAGFTVTVVSDRWASAEDPITSQIAGALWEWPPAVCGSHTSAASLERSKGWCMTSYRAFSALSTTFQARGEKVGHGIRLRVANFLFDRPARCNAEDYKKILEIEEAEIPGFMHDPVLPMRHAIGRNCGIVDAYRHISPVIDTDAYMVWLRQLVGNKGGRLVTHHISGSLLEQEDDILAMFRANIIINAAGLAASEAAEDPTVHPLRGALIRVVNDGTKFRKLDEAIVVAYDEAKRDDDGGIVFILPRNDTTLLLGGLAQPNESSLDLTLDSPEVRRMRARCERFLPGLEHADLDPHAPLVQALRPARRENVRVEREPRRKSDGSQSRIVHSYGHGGSGFTLSFGCAGDVLQLCKCMEHD